MKNEIPRKYLVRVVNADWEVSNGFARFKASSIIDAFKLMFQWETDKSAELRASKKKTPPAKKKTTRARRS